MTADLPPLSAALGGEPSLTPITGDSDATEAAYQALHREIVQGRLAPNQRLVETDLIESLGVSRGVVRLVLARLENEGLIVRERNRGARVRMVTESEAFEITQARSALEALCAQGAALNATDDDISELRGLIAEMHGFLDAGDLLAYSDTNSRMHAAITRVSGNQTATRLIAGLKAQMVRFQYRTILVAGRSKQSVAEHTAIVEAIANHDGEAAAAAMRLHLQHVAETLKDTAGARSQHDAPRASSGGD
jgi:DNA-binding GntR family transcriptional regulator